MVNYLDELLHYEFPLDQFALFGSAPLVVRRIRENNADLDLIVTDCLWSFIVERYNPSVKLAHSGHDALRLTENIEIFRSWPPFEHTEPLIEDADIIDNVRYVKLAEVMKWKASLGREKDLADIKAIESYLIEGKALNE